MPSIATRAAYAKHKATLVTRTDAIDGSYTTGGEVLTATAPSSDATATIGVAAHSRVYGAETGFGTVALSSGSITGKAFGSEQIVYYDDITLRSTSVTFFSSTSAAVAQANFAPGRHCLGPITMPSSAGAASSTGGGTSPPGGGYDGPIP
jgi:hypothetical protein